MFKKIVHQLEGLRVAISGVGSAVRAASEVPQDSTALDAVLARVASLEGAVQELRGEVSAGVIKAEALKGVARAAEDRARGHMKRAEGYAKLVESIEDSEDLDPFEEAAREYEAVLSPGDDEPSNPLPSLSNGLEGRRQSLTLARSLKRGPAQ